MHAKTGCLFDIICLFVCGVVVGWADFMSFSVFPGNFLEFGISFFLVVFEFFRYFFFFS